MRFKDPKLLICHILLIYFVINSNGNYCNYELLIGYIKNEKYINNMIG